MFFFCNNNYDLMSPQLPSRRENLQKPQKPAGA